MEKKEKYILAYDHGTSGMKTAIISTHGEVLGFEVEEFELYHFEAGCAEQDPNDWWDALVKTTKTILAKKLVPVKDIVAIVSSNQMDGTIPVDKDGNILHNCITWMDTRGAKCIKKDYGGPIAEYNIKTLSNWIKRTGGAPGMSGKDIIAHILWLKEDHLDIYEKTWKFLDCKDYINYKLTGKVVSSYDCAILTWLVNDKDPNNIHYDEKLLKLSGIPRSKLPDIFPSTHIIGDILPEIAKELGFSPKTKVILGAGDMSSAAVGSGAINEGQCHICIGSSSWVITHSKKRKLDIIHMVPSLPSAIPGKFILFGEQESAGINLKWLKDNILYHKDQLLSDENVPDVYKIFDKLVESTEPGAKKLIFTPWMFGERCPVENPTIRGGIFNISLDIDRRHLLRAIFEGVAFNSRWVLKYVSKLKKNKLKSINLIGGGSSSDVWCQIYADILNREIKQVANGKESNSIGAAFIASVALGEITWDEIPDLIKIKRIYRPREKYRARYDELFKAFTLIYKNNKKMYKKLNS